MGYCQVGVTNLLLYTLRGSKRILLGEGVEHRQQNNISERESYTQGPHELLNRCLQYMRYKSRCVHALVCSCDQLHRAQLPA
jgi:hypothetical protein